MIHPVKTICNSWYLLNGVKQCSLQYITGCCVSLENICGLFVEEPSIVVPIPDKVYVVQCTTGCWDNAWYIDRIYHTPKDAEDRKNWLNAEAQRIKDECPSMGDPVNMEDFAEKGYYAYWRLPENKPYNNWDGATVVEYSLNKTI